MNAADFDYVRLYVRKHSAMVLEPGKEYLVESRLEILAGKENIASVEELVRQLRCSSANELHRKVLEAMTINETSFFRDLHPFEALKEHILPELVQRHRSARKLNFWCGAASSGQEPFSVLMLIAESFPELLGWDLTFLATDLSSEILAQAKSGRFSQFEVNRGLPARLLIKYFKRKGSEFEFSEDLRGRIDFREMNLVKKWPYLPPLDIVFLRNVLIYFDLESRKVILGKIRRLLRPGGYLFLGGVESTCNLDDSFQRIVFGRTSCFRVKQL